MNKNKIIITSVVSLFVVLALLGGYKLLDTVCYPLVKAEAEYYLCKKYNAGPEEFELVDYKRAKIYWDDPYIFFLTPKWTDFSFEFKYNNRNFFVNRENGEFYDDYQLEDIEKWCTEWLQENVDERITGFRLYATDIICYQNITNKENGYVIHENDAKEFLNNYAKNDDANYVRYFYLFDDSFDSSFDDCLAEKIKNSININAKCSAENTALSVVRVMVKTVDEPWKSVCKLGENQ